MHKFLFPETHVACPDASGLWVFDYRNDMAEMILYLNNCSSLHALYAMHAIFLSNYERNLCLKPGLFLPIYHVL